MSCEKFAEAHGLNARTLSWWTWKLGSEGVRIRGRSARAAVHRKVRTPALEVVEVQALPLDEERVELEVDQVKVRLPDGFRGETLSRVLEVLEARR